MGAAIDAAQQQAEKLDTQLGLLNTQLGFQWAAANRATSALNDLTGAALRAGAAQKTATGATVAGGAAALVAAGRWRGLLGAFGGKTTLFGGALGTTGILATVGAVHLLTDAIIETAAVVIPASVALAAFGVAAIPTIQTITAKMQAVYGVSQALGQNIYPLTGGFSKLAAAVQPEVYQLFGQALVVINRNVGFLTTIATGAGRVLDNLGARAAAAVSGGLGGFLKSGPADLAKIGNIVGNIFGTVGNLLKTMPGYAQTLLSILDGLSRALEAVTASPVTQGLIKAGLYFHGFIVYVGLAVSGAVLLGNALLGLASRFGLVAAGTTVFNAALFGAGIKAMLGGVVDLGAALFTMAGAEAAGAAGTRVLAGAMVALDAVNPLVWVAAAAAGIGFLVYQLTRGDQATKVFVSGVQTALGGVPLGSLSANIAGQHSAAVAAIASSQRQLNALIATGDVGANSPYASVNAQAVTLSATLADNKALLPALAGDTRSWAEAMKLAHGNLDALNAAGVTSSDVLQTSGNLTSQTVIKIQAAADAYNAMALGTGRSAAAQNAALNSLAKLQPAIQQNVIGPEDAMIAAILGGQQGFLAFEQTISGLSAKLGTPPGLAAAAKVAGSSLSGLNAQSVNLRNNFYNDAIPAAQSLIDKLEQQNISTGKLRTVVATEVAQMVPFTKGNIAAKSVLVDLINNALGPGTVTMQSFNGWVAKNQTSLGGFNSIIAKSTIAAGNLAGVLKGMLNAQFAALVYQLSGVGGPHGALAAFTADIMNSGTAASKTASDRATLISDLEKTGMNAKTARQYVRNLEAQIALLKGKTVDLQVNASGTWTVGQGVLTKGAPLQIGPLMGKQALTAAGWYVSGGSPGKDSVPILAMPGELVVPKHLVDSGATAHLRGMIPGYAAGGVVGSYTGTPQGLGAFDTTEYGKTLKAAEYATAMATSAAMASASAFGSYGAGSGGANAALARRMYPAWGQGAEWAAWNYVGMRESGWNAFAANPTSNARGIAQNIAGWGPNYQPGNAAQQIAWMIRYILGRYNDPIGAAAHERAFNWYGNGLAGGIFSTPTLIGVGDKGPERVDITPLGGGGSVAEQLLAAVRAGNKLLEEIADLLAAGEPGAPSSGVPFAGAGARAPGYRAMFSTRG